MNDWYLTALENLEPWDGMCLWYKKQLSRGRKQRCTRKLRIHDGERDLNLENATELVEQGIRPSEDDLMALAGSLTCTGAHYKFRELLCELWIEQWDADHPDQDDPNVEEEDDDEDQSLIQSDGDFNTQESQDIDDFEDSGFYSQDDDDSSSQTSDSEPEDTADAEIPMPILTHDDDPASPSSSARSAASQSPTPPIALNRPTYARHLRPYKLLSPREISQSLEDKLLSPLSVNEIETRTIYGFREAADSQYMKIGITGNFAQRSRALFNQCGIRCEDIVFRLETRHGGKVEHLLQKHLAAERRLEDVTRLEGPRKCQHCRHVEWFEVGNARATEVAEAWVRFMELEPFEEVVVGETWVMKREWKRRIMDVDEKCANGDRWLRWLEQYAPLPAPEIDVAALSTQPASLEAQVTASENPVSPTGPQEIVKIEDDTELESVVEDVYFGPSTVYDDTPPQPQPADAGAPHPPYVYTTPTAPSVSLSTSELLHPNLLTRFLCRALQLFFFLAVVGSISSQQFASLAILGIVTFMTWRDKVELVGESGECDMGLLGGVWYPDLAERVDVMEDVIPSTTVEGFVVY